ncbi:hypothetical protein GCM10010302_07380 [Streptomyces polychromogenes]|uniref:Uncharacterized protein n=1 Tax=Streptomyces polychromogenes TaxID=67342 RepID=A0ABP3ESI8_9ACTN
MPEGDGVACEVDGGEGAVDEVHVGQADARGLHLDQHLAGSGRGNGDFFDGEGARGDVQARGTHEFHERNLFRLSSQVCDRELTQVVLRSNVRRPSSYRKESCDSLAG